MSGKTYRRSNPLARFNQVTIAEYQKSEPNVEYRKSEPKKRNRERELRRYAEQKAKLVPERGREIYDLMKKTEAAILNAIDDEGFGNVSYTKLRNRLKKLLEILRGAK